MAVNSFSTLIPETVRSFMPELMEIAKRELREQGHTLTGSLEESMEISVRIEGNTVIGEITFHDYGEVLDKGVLPHRVPYKGGSGTHSAYIEGLKTFWVLRGLSNYEATRAAFATARKHATEGMPTASSYSYSSNSRRLEWKDHALEKSDWKRQITQTIQESLDTLMQKVIDGHS